MTQRFTNKQLTQIITYYLKHSQHTECTRSDQLKHFTRLRLSNSRTSELTGTVIMEKFDTEWNHINIILIW